jgi:RHH-type rel operon transcriptional repressor/antitoxin RelB
MPSTILTVRVDTAEKDRLEGLAKTVGRSRSSLAAEAISEYLNVNEWQVAATRQAMASLDRGQSVPHESIKDCVVSWNSEAEHAPPQPIDR